MRFLLLTVAASPEKSPSADGGPDAIDRFNRALREAGVLLGTDRLRATSSQSQGHAAGSPGNGRASMTGYWLIQVRSLDEALAWAHRCPLAPDEVIEIQQAIPHGARD